MNTIYNLIKTKVESWIELEQENNQSIIKNLLEYIDSKGKLRPPQTEAIQTYLWIKFVANNKKLYDAVTEGLLYDDIIAREYDNYYTFKGNYVTQFLNQFFQDNKLKDIHKNLINDPNSEKINWNRLLTELLHNFDYANYLYSLPMGAGKTFLMACFIYLDLYFAILFKEDKRFAHNFIIFAPHASKTAILPSLKTIKKFNPKWILPENDAVKLKQIIHIEILDNLSSKRKDKLQGNNPNLEKVNRIKQTKKFGLVFITNAEKVVLEKYHAEDEIYLDPKNIFYDEKKASETEKTNELREALSQIPNITVILDEVHHSYTNTGNVEKKLRLAVNILNQYGHVNSVLGLSGTPYVKNTIKTDGQNIRLNQIQDIVYHYSLNAGIGKFLKKPDIRKVNVKTEAFLKQALRDFFNEYNYQYKDGSQSKIAFYCPSIKTLNEDILPIIQEWYNQHRSGYEDEIFRYYSNVDRNNKQYSLPKNSLAIFNNLDKPHSKKRVILLVAIGAEGWDCKSLTAVVLPRQKTTRNFVLQTTCRCLREVDDASNEKALIYLSEDNYETLDRELQDNYRLSISDLTDKKEQTIIVQVRKPQLGKLKYKQIDTKYSIVKRTSPEIKQELNNFKFSTIKERYDYDKSIVTSNIGKFGLTSEKVIKDVTADADGSFSFLSFLYSLADCNYGLLSEGEMENCFSQELNRIYTQIEQEIKWIDLNPHINIQDVINMVAQRFMGRVEYSKQIIEQETEIELLEWEGNDNPLSILSATGAVYQWMPKLYKSDLFGRRGYAKHPEYMESDFFGEDNNVDPQDISYNYVPYKMDSGFEQGALEEMLKLAELKDLEVYFNGYKNAKLQSFWIQTPRGKYTPDFLILKRKDGEKYRKNKTVVIAKVMIIETKGKLYYNEEFRAKEKFVKEEFLKHNPHFIYHCFVDEDKNDFTKHLHTFKRILQEFLL